MHEMMSVRRCITLPATFLRAAQPVCAVAELPLLVRGRRMCRERFLLTSEAALKAHLTEFKDHELLATR